MLFFVFPNLSPLFEGEILVGVFAKRFQKPILYGCGSSFFLMVSITAVQSQFKLIEEESAGA